MPDIFSMSWSSVLSWFQAKQFQPPYVTSPNENFLSAAPTMQRVRCSTPGFLCHLCLAPFWQISLLFPSYHHLRYSNSSLAAPSPFQYSACNIQLCVGRNSCPPYVASTARVCQLHIRLKDRLCFVLISSFSIVVLTERWRAATKSCCIWLETRCI